MLRALLRSIGTVLVGVLVALALVLAAITVMVVAAYLALWPPRKQPLSLSLARRLTKL